MRRLLRNKGGDIDVVIGDVAILDLWAAPKVVIGSVGLRSNGRNFESTKVPK
jgi:hypothetical protein